MTTDAFFEPTDSDAQYGKGKPQSPYNSARSTECGHYEEWDSTPGNERIRFQHRIGSFQEYQATGNVVHKIVGNGYHLVLKDDIIEIQGNCRIVVHKDAETHIMGDLHFLVDGDMTHTVKGDYNLTVQGDYNTNVEGAYNVVANDVQHQAVNEVSHSGNLNVRGDIYCQQSISALGNLTAGGHLSVQGSLQVEGAVPATGGEPLPHMISGIFPGAGMIVDTVGAIALITPETLEVITPLSNFTGFITTEADVISIPAGVTLDSHVHISTMGPTSPPIG